MNKSYRNFIVISGTFLYTGKIPGPGGTIGSAVFYALAAVLLLFVQNTLILNIVFTAVLVASFALCVLVGRNAQKVFGQPDPNCVVLDEVAGAAVTMLCFPYYDRYRWAALIGVFFCFRFFDIFKPLGIRQLESVGNGFGIVLDDVGAGLGALICVQVSRFVVL